MASRCVRVSQEHFEFASETSWVAVAAAVFRLMVMVGGGLLGHWPLIRAHTLQVVQVVGVQRSLCVCVWHRNRQERNCQ